MDIRPGVADRAPITCSSVRQHGEATRGQCLSKCRCHGWCGWILRSPFAEPLLPPLAVERRTISLRAPSFCTSMLTRTPRCMFPLRRNMPVHVFSGGDNLPGTTLFEMLCLGHVLIFGIHCPLVHCHREDHWRIATTLRKQMALVTKDFPPKCHLSLFRCCLLSSRFPSEETLPDFKNDLEVSKNYYSELTVLTVHHQNCSYLQFETQIAYLC